MMPHEYEREIRALKENMSAINQIVKVMARELDASEKLHNARTEVFERVLEKIQQFEDKIDGQANTQSRKGPQERPKGYKKAPKDGQEV
jgi:uncharacterized protein YdcH (DUF465 family)